MAFQKFLVLVFVEKSFEKRLKTVFLKQVKERQKPPFLTFLLLFSLTKPRLVTQTSYSVKTIPALRLCRFFMPLNCSSGLENQNLIYKTMMNDE